MFPLKRISLEPWQPSPSPMPNPAQAWDSPPSYPLRLDIPFHATIHRCNTPHDMSIHLSQVCLWRAQMSDREHPRRTINESTIRLNDATQYRSISFGIDLIESHFYNFTDAVFVNVIHRVRCNIVFSKYLLFLRIHIS